MGVPLGPEIIIIIIIIMMISDPIYRSENNARVASLPPKLSRTTLDPHPVESHHGRGEASDD